MPLPDGYAEDTYQWWRKECSTAIYKALPRSLYHYTSSSALHAILTEGALRGGNYAFMNDRREFTFSHDLLMDAIFETLRTDLPTFLKEWLLHCSQRLWYLEGLEPYILSFCQKGDLLGQWRGYGQGESRYCIRFDTRRFKDDVDARAGAVIYSERKQRGMIREMVRRYIAMLRPYERQWDEAAVKRATRSLMSWSALALVYFKHASFAEEREWRFVRYAFRVEAQEITFLKMSGMMKPYGLMLKGSQDGGRLPVTEIIVGPTDMMTQSFRSAELMLRHFGYTNVKVRRSKVPAP